MKTIDQHTVSTLIVLSGDTKAISKKCELTTSAVAKWRVNGIPDRYWSILIGLTNNRVTSFDFFEANERIRNKANL